MRKKFKRSRELCQSLSSLREPGSAQNFNIRIV